MNFAQNLYGEMLEMLGWNEDSLKVKVLESSQEPLQGCLKRVIKQGEIKLLS